MLLLFLALFFPQQAPVVYSADSECHEIIRIGRPVAEIEIWASARHAPGQASFDERLASVSRVTYSANQRNVTITTSGPRTREEATECSFDGRGRLAREATRKYSELESRYRTTTTSYEYGRNVTITRSQGRTTHLYLDAGGRILRGVARGPGGYYGKTIEYTYLGDRVEVGSSWSETDVSGQEFEVFDKRGNRTRFEANSGGLVLLWSYELFDDLGNWTRRVQSFSENGDPFQVTQTRRIQYR